MMKLNTENKGKNTLPRQTLPPLLFPSPHGGCGWCLQALCPRDTGPAYVTLHVHIARGCREKSASFYAALTSFLVSHLTVHLLTTVPSRHYACTPTCTQIRFSLPTSRTSSLFSPFICAVGYRGRASPWMQPGGMLPAGTHAALSTRSIQV